MQKNDHAAMDANSCGHYYPDIPAKPDLPKIEREMLAFWDANGIFKKSIDNRKGRPEYVFYDGPAFGNGLPHYGHILTSYVKDLKPRYETMRGKHVPRTIGWDCHGLPAELDTEKYLKINGRNEIEKFGIKEFNEACRGRVQMYTGEWEKILTRMGRWIDFDKTYRTMDPSYTESVIWAFKQLYSNGLIYQGTYSIWYSYGAESTVSNSETRQDDCYHERTDTAVTVMFELTNGIAGAQTFMLAWTTTPWTLTSNFALCVGPDIDYAVMEQNGRNYIIGDAAREKYKQQLDGAKLVKIIKGRDLVGLKYRPLFDFFNDAVNAFKVVSADYITTDDGTGIVHIAPFGEEDLAVMEREAISWYAPVDQKGKFTKQAGPYAGMLVFDAIAPIVADLKTKGALVKKEQYRHKYPHCWRTGVPLISMPLDSWYVDVPKIRARMMELNHNIDWIPRHIRDGQMGKWLENARPWAISRSRFWGAPIPVWKSDDPKYPRTDVYGSIAEIERDFGVKITDFHRPAIDGLSRPNPNDPTGKSTMRRVPDVLDCWFESGAMPFASIHYPFENKDWFDTHFPSDLIVEYIAQTRGWFYNMMILSAAIFDNIPFRAAICHGVVVDSDGKKLSKSKRNYPDPMEVIETLGSDSLRWFLTSSPILSGGTLTIDKEGREISKAANQVIMPLWSAFYFFTIYANAEDMRGNEIALGDPGKEHDVLDRYILLELTTLVRKTTIFLDNNHINDAAPLFTEFMETLNNWYVRRSRARFWDGSDQKAFDTLYTVLCVLCRALAPYLPMTADYIFKALTGKESVHLEDWPGNGKEFSYKTVDEKLSENAILKPMRKAREIVAIGKMLREKYGLRNRLPIESIVIHGNEYDPRFGDIIKSELNAKEIRHTANITDAADKFLYLMTPKIGERLGSALKEIVPAVRQGQYGTDQHGHMMVAGKYELLAGEWEYRLNIKSGITGAALPDNTAVVVIDSRITPELAAEGLANDILRFIQDMRKKIGLNVSDRITLEYKTDPELASAIETHRDRIMADSLAVEMKPGQGDHETQIEGNNFSIKINKI